MWHASFANSSSPSWFRHRLAPPHAQSRLGAFSQLVVFTAGLAAAYFAEALEDSMSAGTHVLGATSPLSPAGMSAAPAQGMHALPAWSERRDLHAAHALEP